MVRLRRRGFWIPSRDAAGRSLPGFHIAFAFAFAFAFVICLPPGRCLWCANCVDRT
jgi:hypothetical protein